MTLWMQNKPDLKDGGFFFFSLLQTVTLYSNLEKRLQTLLLAVSPTFIHKEMKDQ